MSTKRTAAESSNDGETTEDSDPVSQRQDNTKRAKLVLLSDTTLEDLPFELLECILVKAVALEVKDMKFAKRVWYEKSDHVINRLCAVCSQWSGICANKVFRNKVHTTLADTVQKVFRFEMLHQYSIEFGVLDMTSMKDEIFILCNPNDQDYFINVLDHCNMAEVKDVIQLPGIRARASSIAGCNVSNCVYVLNMELLETDADSVYRITKAGEHQFTLSLWIATDQKLSLINVSANGNLITISKHEIPNPAVVTVYAADGSLQHKIVLYSDHCGLGTIENVLQKSNGNLVLVSEDLFGHAKLREIDAFGSLVRQYRSPLIEEFSVNFADTYDGILITNGECKFDLLDSEFNLLDVSAVQPNEATVFLSYKLHFNSETNEIMSSYNYLDPGAHGLATFRFI